MTLLTPFSATAQTSSSELYECEDDFGPYESSLPCEDTPCVTECDICKRSYPCDEDCPAIIFCTECIDYHHENMCPKDDEPDIPPIPDDSDDPENQNNDNGQGTTISAGGGSGSGRGGNSGTGNNSGSGNNSNPVTPKKVDRTMTGIAALRKYSDYAKNCKKVADALVTQVYGQDTGSCSSVYQVAKENHSGDKLNYLSIDYDISLKAQECIETIIDNGGVLIAGVDHTANKTINEGTTDHFIVITGYEIHEDGSKCYRYLETGTDILRTQQRDDNLLYCDDVTGKISGFSQMHPDKLYTITQIRPNDGKVWPDTTSACSN